jgi:predicted NAD-dependent protein-ADP-ribosyltransferase YbiA (DUF1768 family)
MAYVQVMIFFYKEHDHFGCHFVSNFHLQVTFLINYCLLFQNELYFNELKQRLINI